MSRRSRLHVPGGLYYVVQRGNARQPIFTDASDYATFEQLLAAMVVRCRTRLHAFYWTKDAIHFAVQIADLPVGRLMQRLTSQYARKVHRKHGESGHLFQQRYHALLVDPDMYLLKLIRYIHLAPVRAGIVQDPGEYTLSSHNAYLGVTNLPWLSTGVALRSLNPRLNKRAWTIAASCPKRAIRPMRICSRKDARTIRACSATASSCKWCRAASARIAARIRSIRSSISVQQAGSGTHGSALAFTSAKAGTRACVITWYATERGIATLAEVARRLERDPSTLFVAVERYRTLRPDLFNIGSLHDSGPLLRRVLTLPQSQQ